MIGSFTFNGISSETYNSKLVKDKAYIYIYITTHIVIH